VMTGGLWLVAAGAWPVAFALYVMAVVGFSGGNIFYDALIVEVAARDKLDRVSALGYALGYLGGGLLFTLNVLMTLHPDWFGLRDEAQAIRLSFLSVAVWWALFSLPLYFFVPESPREESPSITILVREAVSQLRSTMREIRELRVVFTFLIGYWLYIDGVDTIVRMAVDYGLSLGFAHESLITALLVTQFVGFPSAILFGRIGDRLGARTGIFIGLGVYIAVTAWGYFLDDVGDFYCMAVAIGLVQGGVQSLSRSLFATLVPPSRSAEFFGFYNMLGKFAAVLGPILMGWVGVLTGNPRASILAVVALFAAGGLLLARVDVAAGQRIALEMEARGAQRR